MKLNFIFPTFFGVSGYDVHCRNLANAVYEINRDVRINAPAPQGWEAHVNDGELLMFNKLMDSEYATVMITPPPQWRFGLCENPRAFFGFVIWEGDTIPESWVTFLDKEKYPKLKGIFVASEQTKQAILDSVKRYSPDTKIPDIHIVPHGVNVDMFKPIKREKNEDFTFIVNKGWRGTQTDRGGVQFFLKAYHDEFNKDDKVKALVKLNPAYLPPEFDFSKALENIFVTRNANSPKLSVNTAKLELLQLNELYNSGDIYVCPQMGDAFNLGGVEAMAAGLPTIQTDFGGQLEYVNDGNSWLVKSEEVEVTWDRIYEGIKWRKPDIKELRKLLRYVYDHPEEVKQKGEFATRDAQAFTWRNSATKLIQAIRNSNI